MLNGGNIDLSILEENEEDDEKDQIVEEHIEKEIEKSPRAPEFKLDSHQTPENQNQENT